MVEGPLARLRALVERGPVLAALLLLPAAVLLGGLLAYPLAVGGWLGFHDTHIGGPGAFIGLDNYRYLVTDPVLRVTAFNTLVYTFLTVIVKMALGLTLAVILNRRFAGYRFWRSVLLLPYIVPTVLSAFAWWWILDPQFSFVSWALRRAGIIERTPMRRLGEPDDFKGVAVFLASKASDLMTGFTVAVDGGWLAW